LPLEGIDIFPSLEYRLLFFGKSIDMFAVFVAATVEHRNVGGDVVDKFA
jgi:hypothetical protein